MRVESPDPELRRRATAGEIELTTADDDQEDRADREGGPSGWAPFLAVQPDELRSAAGVGAAALTLTSSGEVVLLAALLGLAAGELMAAVVAMLATGAVALRWGTTSLEAITGAQSVLGPGVTVGPIAAVAATWCAAAALVLVRVRGWGALVFGITAGLVAVGPGPGTLDLALLRGGAAVFGAALAMGAQRWAPPASRAVALGLAAGAVVLAVLA